MDTSYFYALDPNAAARRSVPRGVSARAFGKVAMHCLADPDHRQLITQP